MLAEERLLSLSSYIRFFKHAATVLLPDKKERDESFGTASQLRIQLEASWSHEAAAGAAMTFAEFFKSYFELLDTWTDSTHKLEYVNLAERLLIDGYAYACTLSCMRSLRAENISCACFAARSGDVMDRPRLQRPLQTLMKLLNQIQMIKMMELNVQDHIPGADLLVCLGSQHHDFLAFQMLRHLVQYHIPLMHILSPGFTLE